MQAINYVSSQLENSNSGNIHRVVMAMALYQTHVASLKTQGIQDRALYQKLKPRPLACFL